MGPQRLLDIGYSEFDWQRYITPLSSPYVMLGSVAAYLLVILLLKLLVDEPVELPVWIAPLHNFNLCIGSAAMFVGCLWESYQVTLQTGSLRWLACMPPDTQPRGPLFFWSYMYYLSKYYEFLDTVILVLKRKPLSFLHVSHHALVCPMSYLWVDQAQSLHQIGLLFNTGIHVAMYYYYFLCSIKIYPRWKKFITTGQIVQFTFSFMTLLPYLYIIATSAKKPGATCAGTGALLFNGAFNAMLLALFINFHIQTYRSKKAAKVA